MFEWPALTMKEFDMGQRVACIDNFFCSFGTVANAETWKKGRDNGHLLKEFDMGQRGKQGKSREGLIVLTMQMLPMRHSAITEKQTERH